jgi:hypothetical protein
MSAVGAKPVYAIFLDIDGVLNDSLPTRDQEEQAKRELFPESLDLTRNQKKMIHARFLEKAAVDRFQGLIDRISETAKVIIVLSSSWRKSWDATQPIREMFREWKFSEHLIDRTPAINYLKRGSEIRQWLLEKRKEHNIQKFVILDDETDIGISGPQFVAVNTYKLLQDEDVERAYAILSAPPPKDYFAELEGIRVV